MMHSKNTGNITHTINAYLHTIQFMYRFKCYLHTFEILPSFPHHIKG